MTNFHGYNKKKNFFEGWYFKHVSGDKTIAFIPGVNIDEGGNKSAFIQIISDNYSYNIPYKFSDFKINDDKLHIAIDKNIFSERGIKIDINTEQVSVKGNVEYGEFLPIKYDIMGPFSIIPFMECNHGIISLYHNVKGKIIINDEEIDLNKGVGYIEKDWGSSFPKSYLWIQCNSFKADKCSIMASIAEIPFMGVKVKGCIAIVHYKEKEYRLCTYNGVKIIQYNDKGLKLKKGKYILEVEVEQENSQRLLAPTKGNMSRSIHESAACKGRFKFYRDKELIFDFESNNCGFESVK